MSGSNKPRWPRRRSCGRGLRFISRIAGKTEEEQEHLVICHVFTLRSVRNKRPETGYAQMHFFVLSPPLLHLLAMTAGWSETSIHLVGAGEYAHNNPSTEQ
jgi:hypothetical protein